MEKRFEIGFDVLYLAAILGNGCFLLWAAPGNPLARLLGAMALVLGGGDVFHLAPRMGMLVTGAPNRNALGFGKWITSITSTVYYVLLYHGIALLRPVAAPWTGAIYTLAALRLVLCCMPQNRWQSAEPPLLWGILRNLPFGAMGIIVIALAASPGDAHFRWLPVAVLLSFLFYLPVVLFGARRPAVGMLMIPKTLAYLWIQWMGTAAVLAAMPRR